MSRYDIPLNNAVLTLGWDNPLQTFFYQLWSMAPGEEDEPVAAGGFKYDEYQDLDQFLNKVEKEFHTTIDETVVENLRSDFDERGETTSLQKLIRNNFEETV